MISIVCYQWRGQDPRRVYLPAHVNTLARALKRTLSIEHRFICIADEGEGFDDGVELIKTPAAAAELGGLQTIEGPRFPSCFRRLWSFSEEARELLGPRILVIDIDTVPVRDWAPLLDREEDFVGWRPLMRWGDKPRVGGGIYLLRTGTHTHVWERFRGEASIHEARAAGYRGSDQAWMSYLLGATAATWKEPTGIYSIRDLQDGRLPLPKDARLVTFNGPRKPWDSELPWVKEHWH